MATTTVHVLIRYLVILSPQEVFDDEAWEASWGAETREREQRLEVEATVPRRAAA